MVSILVPAYNASKYLHQCLDSIIVQTYRDLQVVIIDDGSEDATWEIMKDYAMRDSRVEIYHQDNKGVSSTRNALLSKIRGEFFLFIDSDDWIEKDMVEFLYSRMIHHNAQVSICGYMINEAKSLPDNNESVLTQERIIEEFIRHTKVSGSLWNKLVSSSLLRDGSKFNESISYGEDALFLWGLLQSASCVFLSNKQLYHHRQNSESLSNLKWTPEKKGSGHLVWNQIVNDVERFWPKYHEIAEARFAIEDMWGLYYASLANYPFDEQIRIRQQNIRQNLHLIRRSGLVDANKLITAFVLAYCYPLGRLLKFTRK